MSWRIVTDRSEWDGTLSALGGQSYLQTWGWGEHRSRFGWEPIRCLYQEAGCRPTAAAQFLIRRYPGKVGIVWVPGGPLGDVAVWSAGLLPAVRLAGGLRHVYLRMNATRAYGADAALQLRAGGWSRVVHPLNTGLSLLWDISVSAEARRALLTGNWRHNFKRSGKYDLTITRWENPGAQEIVSLYEDMERFKGLSAQSSLLELESQIRALGDNIIVFQCCDSGGRKIAVRACAVMGDRAWDLLAAASEAARKVYASYATLWELAEECHRRGVKSYDLGGVDPSGNKGVWDFKRGTGASALEYLGEWECSTHMAISSVASRLIALRGRTG